MNKIRTKNRIFNILCSLIELLQIKLIYSIFKTNFKHEFIFNNIYLQIS
jgi:hypothetical protein